jgi:imidazolonepropionase-like amidohydrolase
MCASLRLTLLAFLAVTAATVKASWSPGDIQTKQPGLRTMAGKAQTQTGGGSRLLVIRNVTVIPCTGVPPVENVTVLIRDDRIAAIGPAAEIVIPAGARIIEGAGKFLIPGFIDLHAHLSKARASALGLFVANGVTTIRDASRHTL